MVSKHVRLAAKSPVTVVADRDADGLPEVLTLPLRNHNVFFGDKNSGARPVDEILLMIGPLFNCCWSLG